jgi:hypothetical protein
MSPACSTARRLSPTHPQVTFAPYLRNTDVGADVKESRDAVGSE